MWTKVILILINSSQLSTLQPILCGDLTVLVVALAPPIHYFERDRASATCHGYGSCSLGKLIFGALKILLTLTGGKVLTPPSNSEQLKWKLERQRSELHSRSFRSKQNWNGAVGWNCSVPTVSSRWKSRRVDDIKATYELWNDTTCNAILVIFSFDHQDILRLIVILLKVISEIHVLIP